MYAKLIKNGTIQELTEFTIKNFHQISHTESFGLILERLSKTEDLLKAKIPSFDFVVSEVFKNVEVYNQESVIETYRVIVEALETSAL